MIDNGNKYMFFLSGELKPGLISGWDGFILQLQFIRGPFMPELRTEMETVRKLQGQVHLHRTVLLRCVVQRKMMQPKFI